MTHDYVSHGTTTLFAALNVLPRWTFHYTPTSGTWLNAVETFFSALTRRRLQRGAFGPQHPRASSPNWRR